MRERDADADTARWRSLDAARGMVLREGRDYRSDATRHWIIRRSVRGRINQVDLVVNGITWRTGACVHAELAIKRGRWLAAKRGARRLALAA